MAINTNQVLVFFSVKYNGSIGRIYTALKEKERIDVDQAKRIEEDVSQHTKYITLLDVNFPSKLKSTQMIPFVLYYEGNYSLFKQITPENERLISVTGTTKQPTNYGKHSMREIMSGLSKDSVIIVGEQEGMNLEVVKAAIEAQLRIILVLNRGIKASITPGYEKLRSKILKNKGLIISQFPYQSESIGIEHTNYPLQNGLVAVLGNTLWITEIYRYKTSDRTRTTDSQADSTLAFALMYNSVVACTPYPITARDQGIANNTYILEGANPIESGKQLNALSRASEDKN